LVEDFSFDELEKLEQAIKLKEENEAIESKVKEEIAPETEALVIGDKEDIIILSISDVDSFVNILKAIKTINSEVKFEFKEDRLTIQALGEPTNYMLIVDFLNIFFDIIKNPEMEIIIDVDDLIKLCRSKASKINIIKTPKGELIANVLGKSIKKSNIPLYEEAKKTPDVDKILLPVEFTLTTEKFAEIVADINTITPSKDSKNLVFENKGGYIQAVARFSQRWTEINTEIKSPTYKDDNGNIKEIPVYGKYNMTYVDAFAPLSKVSEKVKIEMGNNQALKLTYAVPNKFKAIGLIAPIAKRED